MKKRQKTVWAYYFENEAEIAKLYLNYAKIFPQFRKIWERIAQDEKEHAETLHKLSLDHKDDNCFTFNKNSLNILKYISDFISEEIRVSRYGKIGPDYAFETSLRLEQSMIEHKCFEMFRPRSEKVLKKLQKINHETRQHKDLFNKELRELINRKNKDQS